MSPVAAMETEKPPSGPMTRIGIAARMPTAMAALAGVRNVELTRPHRLPPGRCRSRLIENIIRVAAPWIASVQTKTEARITNRYSSPTVIPATISAVKVAWIVVAIGKPNA